MSLQTKWGLINDTSIFKTHPGRGDLVFLPWTCLLRLAVGLAKFLNAFERRKL